MPDDEEKLTRQDQDKVKNLSPKKRREKIREYDQRKNFDRETLANIFGVSKSTIDNDRRIIKEENISEVTDLDKQAEVGSHIQFFRSMISEAWDNYKEVDIDENPRIKQEFFRLLVDVRNRMTEIQFKTGLIPERSSSDWINSMDLEVGDNSSGDGEAKEISDMDTEEIEDMANDISDELKNIEQAIEEKGNG
jgi:hypothetical protein